MKVDFKRILFALLVAYVVLDLTLAVLIQDEHPGLLKAISEIVSYEAGGRNHVLIAAGVAVVAGVLAYKYLKC